MTKHSLPPNIKEFLEEIWERRQEQLHEEFDSLTRLLEICESPLEQILLLDFVKSFDGKPYGRLRGQTLYLRGIFIGPEVSFHPNLTEFNLCLKPQYLIPIKKYEGRNLVEKRYRADFLLTLERRVRDTHDYEQILRVAIEVDGHSYHERTKEQAERDRSRDRSLAAEGYIVMRFTGREIVRNQGMTSEVEKLLLNTALINLGEATRYP